MELFIFIIVIIGALIAIASAIWVAFALGNAISIDDKKNIVNTFEQLNVPSGNPFPASKG